MKKLTKIRTVNVALFGAMYLLLIHQGFVVPYDSSSFGQGKVRGGVVAITLLLIGLCVWFTIRAFRETHSATKAMGAAKQFLVSFVSIRWWWHRYL